jgi:hypothetical protein
VVRRFAVLDRLAEPAFRAVARPPLAPAFFTLIDRDDVFLRAELAFLRVDVFFLAELAFLRVDVFLRAELAFLRVDVAFRADVFLRADVALRVDVFFRAEVAFLREELAFRAVPDFLRAAARPPLAPAFLTLIDRDDVFFRADVDFRVDVFLRADVAFLRDDPARFRVEADLDDDREDAATDRDASPAIAEDDSSPDGSPSELSVVPPDVDPQSDVEPPVVPEDPPPQGDAASSDVSSVRSPLSLQSWVM